MKYGIVADVHGNYPALKAVIEDGKSRGVDSFIFVGDYFGDLPYPNETYEMMKNESNHIIRGNKEDYLTELHMSARSQWTHLQFAALYWSYDEIKEDNLFDLINLPEDIKIIDESTAKEIFITHDISKSITKTSLDTLTSQRFSLSYDLEPFHHIKYLNDINKLLNEDHLLELKIKNKTPDIYIFGHTHLQWYSHVKDKIFINPGSCGKPLDYNTKAPYTILNLQKEGIEIEEVRVVYNINQLIEGLADSELYNKAKDWSDIVINELKTGRDDVSFFFQHLFEVSKECGENSWPASTFIWNEAVSQWKRR